jgi:hypothetical protein
VPAVPPSGLGLVVLCVPPQAKAATSRAKVTGINKVRMPVRPSADLLGHRSHRLPVSRDRVSNRMRDANETT